MILFNGKAHALELEKIILAKLPDCPNKSKKLAIIQVGDNSSSDKYIELKLKLCDKIGITTSYTKIPANLSDDKILAQIKTIYNDTNVGGAMVQMPLPRLSLNSVLNEIPLAKDVDMLSSKSMEQFLQSKSTKHPPVVRAIEYFLATCGIDLQSKSVTVVGYGQIVGKPVAGYLSSLGAKVTVLDNYKTGDILPGDVVILCAGIPNLVNGDNLAPGSSVIDFGSSVVAGSTVGDLNLQSGFDHLSNVSPSPGGMGPLVVRFLVMNFLGI